LIALACLSLSLNPLVLAEAETSPEYYIHFQPKQIAGMLVHENSRQWASLWVAHKEGFVEWLDPNTGSGSGREYGVIRDGWFVLTAFDQWSADCVRAELEDINSGVVTTIQCSKGHYYIPLLVPRDPFRVRVWGVIAGGPKKFYWEADFFPNEQKFNPCWYEGPKTAQVIRQQEVWFDTAGGWVRGTGTAPFDAAGKPIRPQVIKQWEVTVARGYGVWTMQDLNTGDKYCAYSTWEWK
jgi:hypothetical protein